MSSPAPLTEPDTRRWSRREFARMAELGWFTGQRAELIEGQIMVLSPQNFPHFVAVDRLRSLFEATLGAGVWVRQQGPMGFGTFSEPEPDISVVAGQRADYQDHPTTALLLIEVSDTTLAYDRNSKASLYAAVGIAEYWIVNLVDDQVEVYRLPAPDSSAPHGARYHRVRIGQRGDRLDLVAFPGIVLAVDAVLG